MKIYIDAGHGGTDSGAIGNGLKEKDLTLNIALKIKSLLAKYQVDVRLSRETDETLSLTYRTNDANRWGADFLLSVHIKAGGGEGYEDYIFNKLSDSSTSGKIRSVIHEQITMIVYMKNRGMKKDNFHMLRESNMSSMLTENGFIDNVKDANKLKLESYLLIIALGHVNGLVKAFGLKPKQQAEQPKKDEFYQIIAGTFTQYENAEKASDNLKKKGIDNYIVKKG